MKFRAAVQSHTDEHRKWQAGNSRDEGLLSILLPSMTRKTEQPSKLNERGPLSDYVYRELTLRLRSGSLRPGDRLREQELAEALTVSRTPVREALKRLESEGVLTFVQARVLVVSELSSQEVMELYAMREALVGSAARLAAVQASILETKHLQHIASQQLNASNPDEASALDQMFHEALIQAAHNRFLARTMEGLAVTISLLPSTTYVFPNRIQEGAAENMVIADCVAARDADGAETAGRVHMQNASIARLQLMFGDSYSNETRSLQRQAQAASPKKQETY